MEYNNNKYQSFVQFIIMLAKIFSNKNLKDVTVSWKPGIEEIFGDDPICKNYAYTGYKEITIKYFLPKE